MGIEKLTSAIIADATKEAKDITGNAKKEADELLHAEKAKHLLFLKSAEDNVYVTMQAYRQEKLAWARLEAKRINAEAKEDAVSNSLELFWELLLQSKKSSEYKSFIKICVNRALVELGKDLTIYIAKDEKSLLPKTTAKVIEMSNISGGVVAQTNDGKFRMDMSFESLFQSKRDELRKSIYSILFEKSKSGTK